MKKPLEKIVSSVKEVGKNSWKFVKDNVKIGIMMFGLGLGSYFVDKVNGEPIIKVYYTTPDTSVGTSNLENRFFLDANEVYDYHDGDFIESPYQNALEIFSYEPGFKAGVNAKPFNTPEFESKLGIKGFIQGPLQNKLKFYVSDPDGDLTYREVIAYDSNDPNTIHNIPKNGTYYSVYLPDLLNRGSGEIATWHIATPALVPGDIASAEGVGKLDGKVDIYDLKVMADSWLYETFEGENYSWGDLDYNRINNFIDFVVIGGSWMERD